MERKLFELYQELHEQGAFFFERKLPISFEDKKSAVLKLDDDFAVFMDTERIGTVAEETELVAHECGHVATGTTHAVYSPLDLVEKHEYKANKWAVHRILPMEDIQRAIGAGCVEPWEIAEELGRTEQFVKLSIEIYRAEGMGFAPEYSDELFPGLRTASM